MKNLPESTAEALYIAVGLTFVPFTEDDFNCYAGVDSNNPMIAYTTITDDSIVVILDGDVVQFIASESDFKTYKLEDVGGRTV